MQSTRLQSSRKCHNSCRFTDPNVESTSICCTGSLRIQEVLNLGDICLSSCQYSELGSLFLDSFSDLSCLPTSGVSFDKTWPRWVSLGHAALFFSGNRIIFNFCWKTPRH